MMSMRRFGESSAEGASPDPPIGTVANTDQAWFDYLSDKEFDEVNFWAPSGKVTGRNLPRGSPFFFKLKAPHHAIGGFGFLGPISVVPLSLAWEAFGEKNGVPHLQAMVQSIHRYRGSSAAEPPSTTRQRDPLVGCRTILEPTFFPRDLWVRAPSDWSRNIVTSKTYPLDRGEGRRIWNECRDRAAHIRAARGADTHTRVADGEPPSRWGTEQTYRPRLGQGAFRLAVTEAYGRACAVTGEHSLPVLDSAHIRPFAEGGPHEVANGILLRTDLHRLYDRGYVTITPDYRFQVSPALREEFDNGRTYYQLERAGRDRGQIWLPERPEDRPDPELLAWHCETVFLG